ncbi:cucumopine synthase-related protein [Actinomadura harenae]|uniref:cucumopine synthase-related protein n=1 Tax=Actinomadura harenae TaxID=2483351 RepID=UPI001F45D477|nr:hypothetical protein [Actinomadura harenae]
MTAELDQRNAELADVLWDSLPYRSLQGHALVAGHHLFHVAPIHDLLHLRGRHRVDRRTAPDGTVFCSRLQHLGIKYGDLTEPMPATPVGQVVAEDVETLARVGTAVWNAVYRTKEPIPVEVRRAGPDPRPRPGADDHRIPRLTASDPMVDELIGDLHAETERIWLQAPAELVDLHAGLIDSGAGSHGTKLTTMLFVNGETRPLGYNVYSGLVQAARQGMPLESLRQMARLLGAVPAEFLAYCGLRRLGEYTDRLMDSLQQIDPGSESARDDFIALMAHMTLYINCLGGWNLHLFPWHLDDHLRPLGGHGVAFDMSDVPSAGDATGHVGGRPTVPRQAGEPAGEGSWG